MATGYLMVLPGGAIDANGTHSGGIDYARGDALEAAPFEGLAVERWMWSSEGLALRPGVDLMVYATIFAASAAGGMLASPCSELAAELGCARETVQRSLSRLTADGLVWSPASVRGRDGGRPVKCHRCCPGPLTGAGIPASAHLRVGGRAGGESGRGRARDEGDAGHDGASDKCSVETAARRGRARRPPRPLPARRRDRSRHGRRVRRGRRRDRPSA